MSHTVSIILPTFNQLGFLRAAVASVQAQTFSDWELLIVDDGSAAATRDYLLELHHPPRIRILSLPHTGNPSLSRNTALREARGEFVAFLDADDVWVPAKLATQIARLRGCPQGRWSYSSFAEIDEQGAASKRLSRRTWRAIQGSIFAQVVTTEAFIRAPSVVVAERELLLEVGGFDEQQRFGDYDLWMRLALKSEVVAIDEPLVRVRVHADNSSTTDWAMGFACHDQCLRKLERTVDRKWLPLLRRERARTAFRLARTQAVMGLRAATWRTLSGSFAYAWPYGEWWLGGAKAIARTYVPQLAVDTVRRRREARLRIPSSP